jgi:hypothetical protein
MLELQRIVDAVWSTRIKGLLVRTSELLVGTHSPIPNLHWNSAAKPGGMFDQINLRSSTGWSHLPRHFLATKGDTAAIYCKMRGSSERPRLDFCVHATFGWTRRKL